MPRFAYRAIAKDGSALAGQLEAATSESAVESLRARGQWPIEIREVGDRQAWWNRDILGGGRLRDGELALVARELSTLLRAGAPLDRSLSIMLDLDSRPRVRSFLNDVQKRVKNGEALSDAMVASGDPGVAAQVGLIRAGEAGGALPHTLGQLADFLERAELTRGVVRNALLYPAIVVVVAVSALAFLMIVVLPRFETIFSSAGQPLPQPAATVMAIGHWLEANWAATLGGAVAAIVVIGVWRNTASGALTLSRWALALPVIGPIISMMDTARFCRTLSLMLSSGVPALQAAENSIGAMSSLALRHRTGGMVGDLRSGAALSQAMEATNAFPKLARNLARVGEESGALPEMLARAGELHETAAERRSRQAVQMIAPAATILLGALVAGIIVSMLSAMLKINDLV